MASCAVRLTSRFRGAVLGLAVGDAVGAPLETRRPSTFTPITDPAGLGVWDPADAADRFLSWYLDGSNSHSDRCHGIGRTTRAALERYKDNPSVPHAGLPTPDQAGNGGLMRVAPVAMAYALDAANGELLRVAPDSCRVTHGAAEVIDRTAAFALLLKGALSGVPRDALLDPAYAPVRAAAPGWAPVVEYNLDGSTYRTEGRGGTIIGGAYVVHSIEAALWAAATADTYRDAILAAINLGNDTDMTAAIAGALAGALWGEEAFLTPCLDALKWRNHIGRMGEELWAAAQDRAAAGARAGEGGEGTPAGTAEGGEDGLA